MEKLIKYTYTQVFGIATFVTTRVYRLVNALTNKKTKQQWDDCFSL